jgi:hypothetical protein
VTYAIRVTPEFKHFFDLWQKQKSGTITPAEEEELRKMSQSGKSEPNNAAKSKAARP